MAKVGYIYKSEYYSNFGIDKQWMENFGCCSIVVEDYEQERIRPQWKQLLESLDRGDELVVSKFSNAVRGLRELALFLELCRVKMVRVVSINDKIDSKGELFPETSIGDVLVMFGSLPEEVAALRRESAHVEQLKTEAKSKPKAASNKSKEEERLEREMKIVNMYRSNFSMDDIWKASGFSSRSSVFRILNKYGVNLNRGKFKGPLGKRDKSSDVESASE